MNTGMQKSTVYQNYLSVVPSSSKADASMTPSSESNVRVQTHTSVWAEDLKSRFNEICSLPLGWDGYSGLPVLFENATFAINLIERLYDNRADGLSTPSLVPGSDGTLQIEWHENGFDIEIDILAPFKMVASLTDCETDHTDEVELQSDITILIDWVSRLSPSQIEATLLRA